MTCLKILTPIFIEWLELVRDTARTRKLVDHLFAHGILATGLGHPVVPRGEEEIRFQIAADHTEADIDQALAAIRGFPG